MPVARSRISGQIYALQPLPIRRQIPARRRASQRSSLFINRVDQGGEIVPVNPVHFSLQGHADFLRNLLGGDVLRVNQADQPGEI